MALKALPGGKSEGPRSSAADEPVSTAPSLGPRRFAPGAPESPGTVPLEMAQALRTNEPVVWWNEKDRISWKAVLATLSLGVVALAAVSLFAPEFWQQPWAQLWKPAAVPLLPALLVLLREKLSMRSILVTDTSVIDRGFRGEIDRIAFRNIRKVRRDLVTGGILLEGKQHKVRIPPTLVDDAHAAIESQMRMSLRSGNDRPDDPLGWLP